MQNDRSVLSIQLNGKIDKAWPGAIYLQATQWSKKGIMDPDKADLEY